MSTSKKLTIAEQLKIKKKEQQSAFLQTASLSKKEMGLTGFEDEWTKRLIIAQHYLKKSNVASLRPILPALLQLKGKPYHLNDHFPFEPFFRTRMPYMTLLKTGRQVSKSTSLSSQGIIFSNAIPYFSTLYVTPLYEMIRRFSHNYVRQFIETSPVKRLFMNSKTINSVLQRSFRNGSTMYFSFAYLDAERTRGIPADKVVIDESVRLGTMISTHTGSRPIETFSPGDAVLGFDEAGHVRKDEVVKCSDHGVRDCYRFEFSGGSAVEATSDSWLATTAGWKRVEAVITDLSTRADDAGFDVGRRVSAEHRQAFGVHESSRLEAARLQLPKVPGVIRVRTHASQESEELRLRRVVESVADSTIGGFAGYRFLVSPGRQEACDVGVARQDDVGSGRVVVHGRRLAPTADGRVQHAGFHVGGSETPGELVDGSRGGRESRENHVAAQPDCELLDRATVGRLDAYAGGTDPTVRVPGDDLQTGPACEGRGPDLSLVLEGVRSGYERATGVRHGRAETVLPLVNVQGRAAQRTQRNADGETRQAGREERQAAGGLCDGLGYPSQVRAGEGSTPVREEPGEETGVQEGVACLQEVDLVRVTWTGKHRVFDLETKNHNTFLAGGVAVHNCQEMNYDFLSIIHETLSGSPFGLKQYAGTPKSLENTIEKLWTDSSQAEFAIKCHHGGCNYWNVPALSHDLVKMIGPWHSGISEQCPGIVCAKCRKPIDPRRNGRWIHAQPNVRWSFAGYHIPQIIMPMHYATPKKWDMLVGKMQGRGNTPMNVFFNEVCGESYDVGSKLVTVTELQAAACLPWENKIEQAEKHLDQYLYKILAVDWGGGGGKLRNSAAKPGSEQRERTSYTVLVVMGMRPDGKIDVIWGLRSLRTHAHVHEAELCIAAIQRFKCSHFVHDFNGAGAIRETLVRQAGFPMGNIIPIAYHASAKKNIMVHKPPTDDLPRDWWTVDKSRSLQLTCELIKSGQLRFFKDDYRSSDDAGLIRDFLALIEEKTERPSGGDVYCITRNPTASDDFAQGVNIGCCALFQLSGQWPDVAAANHLILPLDVLSHVHPQHQPDWDDAGS